MKLKITYFQNDVLDIAPDLIGKVLIRRFDDKTTRNYIITETEAYRGEEDLACHACKGITERTSVMYKSGGLVYVYLIYGMYWMLNFVTGKENHPQAVLIRCVEGFSGPGKVGRELKLDKSFYGESLETSKRIWIEDQGFPNNFITDTRVGIDYAGDLWKNKAWRFIRI